MIIWLASYPKSGNTLLRSMLSSYYFSKDGKFEFKLLKNIHQFPNISLFKNLNINPKTFTLRLTSSLIKDSLRKKTSDAYEKGIFGAPTFVANNKIFWGQDRIEFALKEASR